MKSRILVVLSNAEYERLSGRHELYRLLDEGLRSVKKGIGRPVEEVFAEIRGNLVLTLVQMPPRHNIVQDKQFASMCICKLPVENYSSFYIVNDKKQKVHILRILFNRRERQNIL